MEFSREPRGGVISGDITVSFRLWRRPEVRVGGRYPLGPVHIEIDSMELMPFSAIAEADVRRCGEKDRESLRERAAPLVRSPAARCFTGWSSTSSGTNRAELKVMTERGAAVVAPGPGCDSRPFCWGRDEIG
jgi:hypothetical protein